MVFPSLPCLWLWLHDLVQLRWTRHAAERGWGGEDFTWGHLPSIGSPSSFSLTGGRCHVWLHCRLGSWPDFKDRFQVVDREWWWKVVAEPHKDPGILGLQRGIQSGPERRLDCSELLCNKVLLGIRKGQKEYPLASVSHGVIYSLISYYSELKECLEIVKTPVDLLP